MKKSKPEHRRRLLGKLHELQHAGVSVLYRGPVDGAASQPAVTQVLLPLPEVVLLCELAIDDISAPFWYERAATDVFKAGQLHRVPLGNDVEPRLVYKRPAGQVLSVELDCRRI